MPSGQYTLDEKNALASQAKTLRHISEFFAYTKSVEDTIATGNVNGVTPPYDDDLSLIKPIDHISKACCKKLADEYEEMTNDNVSEKKKIASLLNKAGFTENSINNDCGLAFWTDGADNLVVPDFIRIDVDEYPSRTTRHSVVAVKICSLRHHQSEQEVEWWSRIRETKPNKRFALKTLWEPNDIDFLIKRYEETGTLTASFGRCEYRGYGTIYSVYVPELRVYNLSHGYKDIIVKYELPAGCHEKIHSYMAFRKLERRPTLRQKAFPCPYQTISRDLLPPNEDRIVGLGEKGAPLMPSVWWDESIPEELQADYERYLKNSSVRKRLLPYMEAIGHVENRRDSGYGLLYRIGCNGRYVIPDFYRVNDRHPSSFVIDIDASDEMINRYYAISDSSLRIQPVVSNEDVEALIGIINMMTDDLRNKFSVGFRNVVPSEQHGYHSAKYAKSSSKISSAKECQLTPHLEKLGFYQNNASGDLTKIYFSNGKGKIPDFINPKEKVIVEFNGEYFHNDVEEPACWYREFSEQGYRASIIWESELDEFISSPPTSIDELLHLYPCTYRNKSFSIAERERSLSDVYETIVSSYE